MGAYQAAKEHCDSILAVKDQENVKSLYRRGLAQAGLARSAALFQEEQAQLACDDFKAVLKICNSNLQVYQEDSQDWKDAKSYERDADRELRKLRQEMKKNQDQLAQQTKDMWKGNLGG